MQTRPLGASRCSETLACVTIEGKTYGYKEWGEDEAEVSKPGCPEVARQTHMSYALIERRLASSTQPSTGSIVGVKYVARTCTCAPKSQHPLLSNITRWSEVEARSNSRRRRKLVQAPAEGRTARAPWFFGGRIHGRKILLLYPA